MRVTLSPSFEPVKEASTVKSGLPLLDPSGPVTVLGWREGDLAAPLQATEQNVFGPRGLCLHPNGSLWVADTGHHRLLGWRTVPQEDNAPAEILIGQAEFNREGRNAKSAAGSATMNVPTGLCAWGEGLALADAWNHRVLIWHDCPQRNNQPADIVLGQAEMTKTSVNRGEDVPSADSLYWPYGVSEIEGRLVVADTGNRRVLIWNHPERTGQPADLVLGQPNFETRDENAGASVCRTGMRWPHDITFWQGHLMVADAGNNRVMAWREVPNSNGQACDLVLGQEDFTGCDHNQTAYYPSAATLNMPYAIVASSNSLIVADTANSRLLDWQGLHMGAEAARLSGQSDFASKGDNGWGLARRDSLCWPYGLSLQGTTLGIADSGNNRILLWELAP